MRTTWTFHSAVSLVFGRHAAAQIGEIAKRLPARRAFVVTDAVLERAGVVTQVTGPLREAGVAVELFNGGRPEPSLKLIADCAAAAGNYGPDCIVAVGGGSNLDVAKVTA